MIFLLRNNFFEYIGGLMTKRRGNNKRLGYRKKGYNLDTMEASLVKRRNLNVESLNIDAIILSSGEVFSEKEKRRFFRARCAFLTR